MNRMSKIIVGTTIITGTLLLAGCGDKVMSSDQVENNFRVITNKNATPEEYKPAANDLVNLFKQCYNLADQYSGNEAAKEKALANDYPGCKTLNNLLMGMRQYGAFVVNTKGVNYFKEEMRQTALNIQNQK